MRWRRCDKRTLALGERSKLILPWRERSRRRLRLQGPRPSSPQKRKANTTPPPTPSPPPNKHPFPPSIPLTSHPLNQGILQPQPLLLPSPPPRSPTTYPPPYTLYMYHPTTHITFQQPTSPSQPYLHLPHHDQPSHPTSSAPSPPAQTSSPLHRLYRQHPPSCPMGTLHVGPLHRLNRPWWTPQSIHHPCRPVHIPRRSLLQSLPHHPQGPYFGMVHNLSALLHRQLRRSFTHVLHPFCWQPSTPNYHNLPPGH